jgi:hypothetical protein
LPLHDETFETLLASRRLRATASAASTPTHPDSPISAEKPSMAALVGGGSAIAAATVSGGGKGRSRDRGKMAGLVAGDSDSSALTQESGDESVPPPSPKESVHTGTDAGTDEVEDEDVEMVEPSPGTVEFSLYQSFSHFVFVSNQSPHPLPNLQKHKKHSQRRGVGLLGGHVQLL